MKILNLYAGIGGNRKLWTPKGDEHEITAVEYKPEIAKIYQDFFPNDKMVVADAHEYLLEHYKKFDFIWSSPPCPTHSKARFALGVHGGKVEAKYPDMRLYEEIILLKHHFMGKWCVENVMAYYTPLIYPLTIGRHWYWTNFHFPNGFSMPATGITQVKDRNVRRASKESLAERYGYDILKLKGGVDAGLLLRNAVEPEVGKYILDWAIKPYFPTMQMAI